MSQLPNVEVRGALMRTAEGGLNTDYGEPLERRACGGFHPLGSGYAKGYGVRR